MSQKELAAATGVGLRTITRIETGEAERDGKDADSRSLTVLQRYLRIGPYKPEDGRRADDPPLSQATFAELLNALASRHGQDVRNAAAGGRLDLTEAEVSRRIRAELTPGAVMPRYDGSRYGSEQEAERATRRGEAG